MFDHIKFAQDNKFFDKRTSDMMYKKALISVTKITGERDEKVIILDHLDYLQDTYLDLLMGITESEDDMSKNNDLLDLYVNGKIGLDEVIKEYQTSADVKAATDNTSGGTDPKVNMDIENKDEEDDLVIQNSRITGDGKSSKKLINIVDLLPSQVCEGLATPEFKIVGDDNVVPEYFSHIRTVGLVGVRGFEWVVSYETSRGGTSFDIYKDKSDRYMSNILYRGASKGGPRFYDSKFDTAAHLAEMLFSNITFNKIIGDPFNSEYYAVIFDFNVNLPLFISLDDPTFYKYQEFPHSIVKGEITLNSVRKAVASLVKNM